MLIRNTIKTSPTVISKPHTLSCQSLLQNVTLLSSYYVSTTEWQQVVLKCMIRRMIFLRSPEQISSPRVCQPRCWSLGSLVSPNRNSSTGRWALCVKNPESLMPSSKRPASQLQVGSSFLQEPTTNPSLSVSSLRIYTSLRFSCHRICFNYSWLFLETMTKCMWGAKIWYLISAHDSSVNPVASLIDRFTRMMRPLQGVAKTIFQESSITCLIGLHKLQSRIAA